MSKKKEIDPYIKLVIEIATKEARADHDAVVLTDRTYKHYKKHWTILSEDEQQELIVPLYQRAIRIIDIADDYYREGYGDCNFDRNVAWKYQPEKHRKDEGLIPTDKITDPLFLPTPEHMPIGNAQLTHSKATKE